MLIILPVILVGLRRSVWFDQWPTVITLTVSLTLLGVTLFFQSLLVCAGH